MKILVTEPEYLGADALSMLRGAGVVLARKMDRRELERRILDADALMVRIDTTVDKKLLKKAKKLRIVGSVTTSLDHIDIKYAGKMGIKVVSLHGAHTVPTAEYTVGMMLALCRNVPWAHQSLSSGVWKRYMFIGRELSGKTLGIVGFGKIGKQVAIYARAFGMKIIYYDPYVKSSRLGEKARTLERLLGRSDIITVHALLTKETDNMIGYRQISMMKRDSLLLTSSAKGRVVNCKALLRALKNGKIAGAAIDVFPNEPISGPNDELIAYARGHRNLLVTPHIGGSTKEAIDRASLEIAAAIAGELKGRK
ncbi:MAG: hydroxyacid dehydrogenase [Candidatus Micrarchaeota archaeon]|nr:hydroxyacid dehydrogenase [Candidatus Micrarchaeota archaeon]MDE1847572.1 hydroxyacid dehydrogenase [Candidatus Micrarchaeota archaeon]MDE1864289.1 hydroxyacid dehydrogenase [Candidatus Micrarchaeota archaeon]